MLTDSSPMPFGKWKGTPLDAVPSNYLFWLWTNGKEHDMQCPVADYIRRNIAALELDYPDGIWRS